MARHETRLEIELADARYRNGLRTIRRQGEVTFDRNRRYYEANMARIRSNARTYHLVIKLVRELSRMGIVDLNR